jgi:O-antigen/teichoic acid export membrane protein
MGAVSRPEAARPLDHGGVAARGVLMGVIGRTLSFGLAYLATIILARRLGPAAYGAYGLVISVLLWIEQTARFTIPTAAAKLIPEDTGRTASVQQTALVLGSLLFGLLFLVMWVTAGPLARLFGLAGDGAWLFRVAALDLPAFGLYAVYRGVLQGHRDFLALSVADALYAAAKLLAVVLLLAVSLSVASALAANAVASVIALLYVVSRVSIGVRRPSGDVTAQLLRLALPLGLYMLALQTITNIDLWSLTALGAAGDPDTVGAYVAARNLAVVPGVILMVVSDVLLPSLSGAVAAGDATRSRLYVQGAVRFLLILVTPIAILLTLGADDLMALLFSETFRSGGAFVKVLVLYAVALPFMDLFASALSARGEPYRGGLTLLAVIPLVMAANVVLVGAYGAIGAAYGSAVAGAISSAVLGVLVSRRFGPVVRLRTFASTFAAAALMLGVAIGLAGTLSLPVAGAAGLALYGLTLVGLREIGRDDLAMLAIWKGRAR